jgi:LysM repeat protein
MAVAAFTLIAGPFGIERMLSHDDSNQVKPTPTEPVPTQVPTIEVVSAPNNDARVLVYNDRVCETNGQEITVQSGDTISGIVDDLRQSGKIDRDMPLTDAVDAISRVNNLANPDFIQVGQTIKEIACSPTN